MVSVKRERLFALRNTCLRHTQPFVWMPKIKYAACMHQITAMTNPTDQGAPDSHTPEAIMTTVGFFFSESYAIMKLINDSA